MKAVRCAWIMDRGYHKGERCGNDAKHEHRGVKLCAVHFGLAQDPERFAKQPGRHEK